MRRKLFGTVLLLICAGCSRSRSVQPRNSVTTSAVVGTYEHCLIGCSTIELLASGRFDATIDGDLDHNLHARGTWRIETDGTLLLNGDQQPEIREGVSRVQEGIRFRAIDQNGSPLPNALVSLQCEDSRVLLTIADGELYPHEPGAKSYFRLEPDGFVHMLHCRPTEFFVEFYSQHSVRYRPINTASNEFTFVLDTNTDFYVTNQRYMWKPGYLYAALSSEAGGGWSDFPLKLRNGTKSAQHAGEADR